MKERKERRAKKKFSLQKFCTAHVSPLLIASILSIKNDEVGHNRKDDEWQNQINDAALPFANSNKNP